LALAANSVRYAFGDTMPLANAIFFFKMAFREAVALIEVAYEVSG